MEILSNLQKIIGMSEFGKWIFISILSSIVFSYINVFLFTNLFQIKANNSEKVKLTLIDGVLRFIVSLLVPVPYYRMFNMAITIILYKIFFKQNIAKCILGEIINAISIISIEVIFSKVFCMLFNDIDTYSNGMYDYRYKFCSMFSISVCRALICYLVKKKNITLNISNNLSKKSRKTIIMLSTIISMVIFFNTIEMTMYISDFPYSIFILDIISLIICFYISIKDILKIIMLEEKDMTIHNLESYNKTLSIMYDNIRAFRHDFTNFVQALDGYVKSNNIEGIRNMDSAILRDCRNVNNMGILDPKVINNPAVYSIITNKYYLAREQNIMMNIEVMIDFNQINISSYEFCRILSILLDNAIEAARECDEKVINVRFEKDIRANRKLVIIENTYNKVDIDIDKIFEKGYSTKEDTSSSHGLGLWTVRKILNQSKNLNLFTKKETLFCQQLEIYE